MVEKEKEKRKEEREGELLSSGVKRAVHHDLHSSSLSSLEGDSSQNLGGTVLLADVPYWAGRASFGRWEVTKHPPSLLLIEPNCSSGGGPPAYNRNSTKGSEKGKRETDERNLMFVEVECWASVGVGVV